MQRLSNKADMTWVVRRAICLFFLPVYISEDDLDTVQVQMVTSESPVWSLLFFSVKSAKQGFELCLHIITVRASV